ncbi:hypothetical protein FOZ61_007015 [Perkinsus olseni]|nr:hypothetical protein FOZ61_007015 [Perkinsus olseni]
MPTFTPSAGWFSAATPPIDAEHEKIVSTEPTVSQPTAPPVVRKFRSRGPVSMLRRNPLGGLTATAAKSNDSVEMTETPIAPREDGPPRKDPVSQPDESVSPPKAARQEAESTDTFGDEKIPVVEKPKLDKEAPDSEAHLPAAPKAGMATGGKKEREGPGGCSSVSKAPVQKRSAKRKRQSGGASGPPRTRKCRTKANEAKAKPSANKRGGEAAPSAAGAAGGDGPRIVSNNFVYQNLKHKGHAKSNKHVEKMKRKIGMDNKGRIKEGGSAKSAILNAGRTAGLRRRGGQQVGGYTKAQRARLRRIELAQDMLKSRQLADQRLTRGKDDDGADDLEGRGATPARNTVFSASVDVAKLDRLMEERAKKREGGQEDESTRPQSATRSNERVELPCVPSDEELQTMLREEFGHTGGFRPGQREAIEALLGGASCLVVLPTGQGKSLIYQFIARIYRKYLGDRGGVTVVVSPLISLMADQLRQLPSCVRGATINSTMTPYEMDAVLLGAAHGEVDLLLVAPERLLMWSFQNALPFVNLVAIDEAHCISEWSHSFRPAYQRITGVIRRQLRPAHLLALTATATSRTISSVVNILGGIDVTVRADGVVEKTLESVQTQQEETERGSMVLRRNLRLSGSPTLNPLQSLLELLHTSEYRPLSSIIVYVAYQWQTEQVARLLCQRGVRAGAYHGGMSSIERNEVQEAFVRGGGQAAAGGIQVIVATVAFGMGIDKADVRAVVHMALPRSLESYVQETGRCCRDGFEFGLCHVLICHADYARLRRAVFSDSLDPLSVGSLIGRVLFAPPQDPATVDKVETFGSCCCVAAPAHDEAALHFTFVDEKQGARELDCGKEQLTFLLGLLESAGQGVRGVFHGFPSKVKLRFFSRDPESIVREDAFMRALLAPEESGPIAETTEATSAALGTDEEAIAITVPCRAGVYTIDTRLALPTLASTSGYASITPPEFMRRLHDAQRKWHFAVEKQDYGHVVVMTGNSRGAEPDQLTVTAVRDLAVSLISQVRKHQDHQLVKVDACYLVLRRIAANDNKKDPLFGHRLVQNYFSLASEGCEEEVLLTLADGDRAELRKILGPAAVPHEQGDISERTVKDWEGDENYGSDFNWVRGDLEGLLSCGMLRTIDPGVYSTKDGAEPFWMDESLWQAPPQCAVRTRATRVQGIPSPTYPTKSWKDTSYWGRHEALPFDVLTSMIAAAIRGWQLR